MRKAAEILVSFAPLPSSWKSHALRLCEKETATIYSILNSFTQGLGLVAVSAIITKHLTPIEQGYYFAFLGVVSFQVVVELGFSQCVVQFASSEMAHLAYDSEGRVGGSPVHLTRFLSLGRLAFRWYRTAAVVSFIVLYPAGLLFFSDRAVPEVSWRFAWLVTCLSSSVHLAIVAYLAVVEGTGEVRWIYKNRAIANIARLCVLVTGLLLGAGILSIGLSLAAFTFVFLFGLVRDWRRLIGQIDKYVGAAALSWRREIFPYQWRIALSWAAGYVLFSIVTPVLFRTVGKEEAGRFGLTWTIIQGISTVSMAVGSTRIAKYSSLASRRMIQELDREWKHAATISVILAICGGVLFVATVCVLRAAVPTFAGRVLSPAETLLLCIAMLQNVVVFTQAQYIRAYKTDPLVSISVLGAISLLLGILLAAPHWGIIGVCTVIVLNGIIGNIAVYDIFIKFRRQLEMGGAQ
jgi:O-antigen/teichoic acid export membrane protein